MSNYPNDYDDDATLPVVNDNLTEIGGEAINALRDAVVQLQLALGLNIAGIQPNLAARLGVFINPDGTPNASVLTSLGLVTLPIRNDQIAENAGIPESKLRLDFRTQDLFNYVRDLSLDVNTALGWISTSGIKLEPHLIGAIYRHTMDQIDVSTNSSQFLQNNLRQLRDNTQSYSLVNDINNELLAHQWADGSPFGIIHNITTNNGSVYPSNYAHTASGIFINTSRFLTVPQTADDLQLFADFIDGAGIFLLGTRIQNLYSNGISRTSRSSSLLADGYGQSLIPVTPAVAYLKHLGNNSNPFDDIDTGDDIVEFVPSSDQTLNSSFDEKFALVRAGDIIRVNYGTVEVPFIIKEKKYVPTPGNKRYVIRIAGKNLSYAPNAIARVDKTLVNSNKYGVLAVAPANNVFSATPSLIVTSPRGGQATGLGFSPDEFDEQHYLLYLALYPTGDPADGYTFLPAIDVTGNQGITPGLYTLDSIVDATNTAFRKVGYNYRFIAFSYQGEFGVALADSYNNAAFSIVNGVVAPGGTFNQAATEYNFPNNVVDVFPNVGTVGADPLGFGLYGSNAASPPYLTSYGSEAASQYPTKLFVPLTKNNFYTDGAERERLTLEIGQALDRFGDGYWVAEIVPPPGSPPAGRVETTYRIQLDLSASNLKNGKTLVVQSLGQGSLVDFGRFFIKDVTFGCNPTTFTDITVYDAVHAKGFSPTTTLGADGYVAIYFNSDSVSFNAESATDFTTVSAFKRHFEVYVDSSSATFTQERGRMFITGNSISVNGVTLYSYTELAKMDLIKISPKLRGYQFGSVTKITLHINNYDSTTGIFSGYLASYDGVTFTHQGPTVTGKKGEVVRFYDETNIDYIDIIFDVNTSVLTFSDQNIDIQLFPTLSLDDQVMLIATCQLNDSTESVSRVRDERQFGNVSENELSSSALDYIALPEKLLHFNGVIRGFDITDITSDVITIRGGVALVNGKFQFINNQIFIVPKVKELYSFSNYPINWAFCVNSIGELVIIPLTDYDSVLGTPNAVNRIVTVTNAVTLNTYSVDSIDFKTLIDSRKDLTILYIVSATVTGSGVGASISLTSKDMRRYINDQDSAMPPIVTTNQAQGNFKDVNTALNWLRFDNSLQNTLIIKGAASVTAALNNTSGQMNIYPQGSGSSISFGNSLTAANFRFTDLPVSVSGAANLTSTIIQNCPLTFSSGLTGNTLDISKCTTVSVSGSVTATNHSSFVDGSFSASSFGSFTDCILNNHSIFTLGGTGTFTNTQAHDIGTLSMGSTGTFNNARVRDVTTLTVGSTGSFTNSQFRDIGSMTVSGSTGFSGTQLRNIGSLSTGGTNNFTSLQMTDITTMSLGGNTTFSEVFLNNVPISMTITGSGTFNASDVSNIPDFSTTTTCDFEYSIINNVSGDAAGGLTFNFSSAYDSGIGGASWSSTGSNFKNYATKVVGPFTANNCTFDNCTFDEITNCIFIGCKFINCYFAAGGTVNISANCIFEQCTLFCAGVATVSDTEFEDCTLTFSSGGTFTNVIIDPSTVTVGGTITTAGAKGVSIVGSTLNVSAVRGFTLSNNFRFERNTVAWTGTPVSGYDSTDKVNASNGFMWATIGASSLSDIKVLNNTFSYALQDHFPFFALQMTDYAAIASDITVSGNEFKSTAGTNDIRAAIAIISTLVARAPTTDFPQAPTLVDIHLDNNTCNYDQLLIISGVKDYAAGIMQGACPLTINTSISGNICGTIGYFTSSYGPYDGTNVGAPNNGFIRNKPNKLIIQNNFCKFITNLAARGDYVCFRATNYPNANVYEEVSSTIGETSILGNTCNWIQVGAGGYTIGESGVNIIGNTVTPANPNFLSNYIGAGLQTVTPGNVGILLRREHNAQGSSQSIISGNNIVQKFTTVSSAGFTITNATNASPIVITTSTPHGFVTGQIVNIGGVQGNLNANGTFTITLLTGTTFSLDGSVGNGVYTGGGIAVSPPIYYYDAGMALFNNCRVTDNVISGVVNSTTSPLVYFWDINSQIVTGNILARKGLNCNAYFYMDGLSATHTGAQRLIIAHNELDAQDSGSGVVNRVYIRYGVGDTAPSDYQHGWLMHYNVAGSQPNFTIL